jgi:hypothetical protein
MKLGSARLSRRHQVDLAPDHLAPAAARDCLYRTRLQVDEEELQRLAGRWAERTALEQGLPAKIEDVAVLRDVLLLLDLIDADGKPLE